MEDIATEITIRDYRPEDLPFVQSLSPLLAVQAKLDWHSAKVIQTFQDNYIKEMMTATNLLHTTFLAECNGEPLGFIHAREHSDEISAEVCATVPLLAVVEGMQGTGIGSLLILAVEEWARNNDFRLLHLEVFAANRRAQDFYRKVGFYEDTLHMIKPLR